MCSIMMSVRVLCFTAPHLSPQVDVDITVDGVQYQGTIRCPSCEEMCYVSIDDDHASL